MLPLVLSMQAQASPVAAEPAGQGAVAAGERLEWSVTWLGVEAGTAWATTAASGSGFVFEAGCKSARWLASMYPVDDHLVSTWRPGGGSSRYVTRFREGDFHQDQDMRLAPEGVVIARSQRFEEGWRSWEDHYKGVVAVEDPVSAFQRLRSEAGPVGEHERFMVWNGKKAVPMQIWTVGTEEVAGRSALRVEVLAESGGTDLEPKMTVWVSDDDARLPLQAAIRTRAGPVYATLVTSERP